MDGCPVDGRDDEGRTALMCAAELGNAPLLHVLLEAGANPKLEDSEEYRTAGELAAEAGHHALASMLADRMAVGTSGGWSRPSAAKAQLAVGFVNLFPLLFTGDRHVGLLPPSAMPDVSLLTCARALHAVFAPRSRRCSKMRVTCVARSLRTKSLKSWGWPEFISSADLEAAGFVQDGSLSISARVEMIPRDKLRLELRRENGTASPLLTNLSITLIDGAAPQQNADNVENFQPLSNVDSIQRPGGVHNHQFRPSSQEASVWMDADRLNEKDTSFFGDGSLLVMVGM